MIRVLRIAVPSAIVGAYLYAGWVMHELDKLIPADELHVVTSLRVNGREIARTLGDLVNPN